MDGKCKMEEWDEQLITSVQEYPRLYNAQLAAFKVSFKKENAWIAIAAHTDSFGKK